MKKYLSYLKKVNSYVSKYKGKIILNVSLDFLVIFLSLFYPIMNKNLIDGIIMPGAWDRLPRFLGALAFLYIGTIVISLISDRIFASYSETVWADARGNLFEKLLNLNLEGKNHYTDGDIVQRISEDSGTLHTLHSYFLSKFIENGLTIIGTIVLMLVLDVKLALITCLSVPIFMLLTKYFSKVFSKEMKNIKESNARLKSVLLNALGFFSAIKANAIEGTFIKKFKKTNEETLKHQISVEYSGYVLSSVISIVTNLNQLAIISFGAYFIMKGSMTTGVLVAFLGYSTNMYRPFINLSNILKELNASYTSIDRYLEAVNFADKEAEDYESGKSLEKINALSLENVDFSYKDKKVLNDLSFDLERGNIFRIKGRSGSGKSTVAKLLLRLYDKDSGKILINDKEIEAYNLRDLRENILWISQDQDLVPGPLRDFFLNYGDFTDEEILKALKAVNLMELGDEREILDFVIEKNGSNLSGGQKQRLILGLVFLKSFDLLILDEPFNGIDSYSRDLIWSKILENFDQKIIIVIDHNDFFDRYKIKNISLEG